MSKNAGHGKAALELGATLRLLGAQATIFHVALAERFGLGGSDLRCMAFVREHAPVTAGQLAEFIGLTTGAVTGMIDRLERAGFVRRLEDPNDRRRVLVEPADVRDTEMNQAFALLLRETLHYLDKYSEKDLRAFTEFVRGLVPIFNAATRGNAKELRAKDASKKKQRPRTSPR